MRTRKLAMTSLLGLGVLFLGATIVAPAHADPQHRKETVVIRRGPHHVTRKTTIIHHESVAARAARLRAEERRIALRERHRDSDHDGVPDYRDRYPHDRHRH